MHLFRLVLIECRILFIGIRIIIVRMLGISGESFRPKLEVKVLLDPPVIMTRNAFVSFEHHDVETLSIPESHIPGVDEHLDELARSVVTADLLLTTSPDCANRLPVKLAWLGDQKIRLRDNLHP